MSFGGALSTTVHVTTAGLASVLPARSDARTWNVWSPGARPVKIAGDEHGANGAASRLQANDAASSAVKSKRAPSAEPFGDEGCEVIVVSGGVTSAVTVVEAVPTLRTAASAR